MTDSKIDPLEETRLYRIGIGRWENEGGMKAPAPHVLNNNRPEMINAELVQLRIRVISLENLVITLLAEGSDHQLKSARHMSKYISPRPGFDSHPLTTGAALNMMNLVDRAVHYRTIQQ